MNLFDLIRREAIVTEEPVECDLCGAPARCGHVGGRGWACVACCERRPEYAVSTQTAGGVTTAWIGAHQIGLASLLGMDASDLLRQSETAADAAVAAGVATPEELTR